LRPEQRLEASQTQARPDEEERCERNLGDHERHAETPSTRTNRARAVPKIGAHILSRELPGRQQSEEHAGRERDHEGEHQDTQVETNTRQTDDLAVGRRDLAEGADPPVRDDQPRGAARNAEDQALHERLPHQPRASRAERRAYGHLAPAPGSAGEQQVRDVDTGDEQHEGHRPEQEEQPVLEPAALRGAPRLRSGNLILQRADPDAVASVRLGILQRELRADPVHILSRLLHRRAWLHARVHEVVVKRPVGRVGRLLERERQPRLDRGIGELERRRQYADDLVGHAIERERAPDDRPVGAEPLLPHLVRQHDDVIAPHGSFFVGKRAPEQHPSLEDLEEPRRHDSGAQPHRLAGARQIDRGRSKRRHPFKRRVHLRPVEEIGWCDHVVEDPLRLTFFPHHHESIGIVVRQRAQQNRIDGGEHRRVRANAEREGRHDDKAEAGLANEQAAGVLDVVFQRVHAKSPCGVQLEPDPFIARHGAARPQKDTREAFGRSVANRVHERTEPEPGDALARPPRFSQLRLEQPRHLVAEFQADPARKHEQEHSIEPHPRDFERSRFARASNTAASSRRASASATRAPSGVSSKYRRRSSSSSRGGRERDSAIIPSASMLRSVR
jgi:hypothetical protein